MSKPNTSRVSAVGKAHDDKSAEIMALRIRREWRKGHVAGLVDAYEECKRLEKVLRLLEHPKAILAAAACAQNILRMKKEAEASRK